MARAPGIGLQNAAARRGRMLLQYGVAGRIDLLHQHVIAPEIGQVLEHEARVALLQQHAVQCAVMQDQPAVASQIDVDHLNVGQRPRDIVLPRQGALDLAIAALVVDRLHAQVWLVRVIEHVEQPELADHPRAEELQDEAFVAIVRPYVAQHRHRIRVAGDRREPLLSSAVGSVQMRSMSRIIAKPSAYGLMPE